MTSQQYYWAFLLLLFTGLSACETQNEKKINALIQEMKTKHAPDSRVALFDIRWENDSLKGETNLPEAKADLKERLTSNGISFADHVRLLPSSDLAENTQALVNVSVANLRSEPRHSAELSTQATMGTPLKVLKQSGSWYLVQTPDRYLAWADAGGIHLTDSIAMSEWKAASKIIITATDGHVWEKPDEKDRVSDLAAGNILQITGENDSHYQVAFPDGRSGVVSKSIARPLDSWLAAIKISDQSLISTATDMMGVPYLWGGTSSKGMDCSGFTKTIYFLHGMVLPRDASQQVHEGKLVDADGDWDKLEVGDLLFFGTPATTSTQERVVHVGMWIGNHQFIHASGRVRISSVDPKSEVFDEYELNRYLRAKRIKENPGEKVISVSKMFY